MGGAASLQECRTGPSVRCLSSVRDSLREQGLGERNEAFAGVNWNFQQNNRETLSQRKQKLSGSTVVVFLFVLFTQGLT